MKFLQLIFLSIFFVTGASGQKAESLDEFFKKAEQGQSTYVKYDTTGRLPIIHQMSDQSYYYEVLWINPDSVFFLEESFFGNLEYGTRQICQCDAAEAKTYFKQQKQFWANARKGKFSMNFGNLNFFDKKCMQEKIYDSPNGKGPKIKKLLKGANTSKPGFKKEIQILDLALDVKLLERENGRWLLDLKGKLPEEYTFVDFVDGHRMDFVKDDQNFHYPPPSVEAWKNKLIKSGLFTSKIVGGAPTDNWLDKNFFYPSRAKTDAYDFNLMFSLYPEIEIIGKTISTKGTLLLSCQNKTLKKEKKPISLEAGSRISVSCDGKGLSIKHLEKENTGQLTIGESILWETMRIYDANDKLVDEYHKWKPGESHILNYEKEGNLYLEISVYEQVTIAIPFEKTISTENIGKRKSIKMDEMRFQSFSLTSPLHSFEDKGLRAEYAFNLPAQKFLTKVTIQSIVDNTGKNLLAGQAAFIDSLNLEVDKARENKVYKKGISVNLKNGVIWEKDRFHSTDKINKHEVKLIAFGLPHKNAGQIFIEGTSFVKGLDQEEYSIPWKDTIHLAKVNEGKLKDSGARVEQGKASYKPIRMELHTLESNPYNQGIRATIPFKQKKGKGKVFSIDGKKSELIYFKDNLGKDLISRHLNQFEKRIDFVKTARTTFSVDENFNNPQIVQDANIFYWNGSFPDPILLIRTYAPVSKAATKVIGKVNLALWLYDPSQKEVVEVSKNYNAGEQLVLKVKNSTIPFRKSSFTQQNRSKKEYNTYSTEWPKDLAVHTIVVKDSNGAIVNLKQEETDYPLSSNAIYIPQSIKGETLTFEITYSNIYPAQQEVEFEIGMDLKK